MDFSNLFGPGNPIVSGGLVLMVLGGALYYLKTLPGQIAHFLSRFLFVTIEVQDDDESFQWMRLWLANRLASALSVSVVTRRDKTEDWQEDEGERSHTPRIYFIPAVGTYFFWYKGRFVTLNRSREKSTQPLSASGPSTSLRDLLRPNESFMVRIFSRNRDLARQLLEECRDHATPKDDKLDIRVASQYGGWQLGTRVWPRPLSSVILDGTQAADVLNDMRTFLQSGDWYRSIGIPYRRSYLFYGSPGNGKSSAVKAFATELKMHVYLLTLSDPDLSDARVANMLTRVPDNNILLLEDVDCAFIKRKKVSSGKDSSLTFSGLLNAIDGVASPEGRILIMTTNHIDRLDAALTRPGRSDVKMPFNNATPDQARRLFSRFYPAENGRAALFAGAIPDGRFSMATLQDYLMLHRGEPERAIANAEQIGVLQTAAGEQPGARKEAAS